MLSGNMGGPSCDSVFGEAGLDSPGLGEVGLDEVKLKNDMVMLLLSVFFLGLVGAGLTASAFCIGKLIFLWLSSCTKKDYNGNSFSCVFLKVYLWMFHLSLFIAGC